MCDKKDPGPDPDRLKLEGDWEEAIGDALKKDRPPGGWPDRQKPTADDDKPNPKDGEG